MAIDKLTALQLIALVDSTYVVLAASMYDCESSAAPKALIWPSLTFHIRCLENIDMSLWQMRSNLEILGKCQTESTDSPMQYWRL